jgi:putative endonuclease
VIAVSEPPRDDRQHLGHLGEAAAERKLVAAGFRILERRYRKRIGEIDLIASHGELVVFVEVKTRRTDRSGTPGESVTATKRRRIGRVALFFLSERGWLDRPSRFDVIEVYATAQRIRSIRHIPDAFRL